MRETTWFDTGAPDPFTMEMLVKLLEYQGSGGLVRLYWDPLDREVWQAKTSGSHTHWFVTSGLSRT